ncbi:uroporphyrinogen decarboxylase (URO-D) [Oxobacter pfennigii]|uniref:Uroporphyrinogen decarboxylase (URO-D) n=1 Tax=Oxobacter pfennigii TaxID=36849 RepID=A0A0P8WMN2_9CLOT|nr:uroporphyrinogen decarboxylase family protein [Oxobacter pfennigii]KPU43756.1 uroporphyrinogen decarboxylase (URO-D) [Oxobacter pfennigii]
MNAQELKQYRTKLFTDVYSGIIPERFPVIDGISIDYIIQYGNTDIMKAQYSFTKESVLNMYEKIMDILRGDMFPSAHARNPVALMFQQSRTMTMGSNGFIQHPETSNMEADEYDEFIENPFDFLCEKVLPRQNPGFDTDPITRSLAFAKYVLASMDFGRIVAEVGRELSEKYGFFASPAGSAIGQSVPFDFLADMNRGFTKIPMDIKRQPQKVVDACEALVPYLVWKGMNPVTSLLGNNMIMTHMAPFLSTKDFEKFYWPTFLKICHICAERGQAMQIFCESDWTRFVDHMQDLPQGTRLWMEYGDPQKFKDKLGKKMVLEGFYPLTLLKNGTKQQCIDKAKELIDILAPGGNFIFRFDKSALSLNDLNTENYIATLEYVLENSKYDNAGELVTTAKTEDSIVKYSHLYPEFKSKYIVSFDEFKKVYPPVDDRIEPLMRSAYNKYTNMVLPFM